MPTPSTAPTPPAFVLLDSPIGTLTLVASDAGLQHLRFGAHPPTDGVEAPDHPVLMQAAAQLADYFAGTRTAFDVPLDTTGTAFQKQVWALLQEIPYGTTTSYEALARRLGDANKARAVGLANGKNPVGVIVPCHRVIGKSGTLTGFAGGLDVKAFLLTLEQHRAPVPFAAQADLFAG